MTDKTYFRNWRVAGMLLGSTALLLGSIGLLGWFCHEPALRSFWEMGTEMKFNTALGLALLGGSLMLSFNSRKFIRTLGFILVTLMLLLTSLTLFEWMFGFNIGIDELVFRDTNSFRTLSPGRMAPQSATTFILLALSLNFMRSASGRLRGWSQGIALASLFFPAQALVGYALGNMSIAGINVHSAYMAIPTALAFICGALALLLHKPAESLMTSLTARTPASIVFRRQLLCAIFLPIILGMLVLRLAGSGIGEQSAQFSVASFALVIIFVFVALTWINAAQLNSAARKLAQREALLHESQERYRTLFNSIDEGFCLVEMIFDDHDRPVDYRFLEVNPVFEKQTGLTGALGKRMRELKPDLEEHWFQTYGKIALTGEPARFQNRAETMQRWFDVYAFRFGQAEKKQVAILFNDISERRRQEQNKSFLADIVENLASLRTADDIVRTIGAKVAEHFQISICNFVEINENEDIVTVTHEWRLPDVPSLLGTYKLSEYLTDEFQKILRAGNVFVVRDTGSDPRTDAGKYAPLKLVSFVCAPLIRDGKWKFLFCIHDFKARDWTAGEIELVREITARLWTRLERAHADARLAASEKQLAAELADTRRLQEISARLISDRDDTIYQNILEAAIAIMRSDFGSLQIFHPKRNALRLLAHFGFDAEAAKFWEWVHPDSGSTCGVALQTRRQIVVTDIETCDFMAHTDDLAAYRALKIRAVQTTPLVSRSGELLGMISTHWHERRQPSERELGLLAVLGRQAADLIERRQDEERRQQVADALRQNEALFSALIEQAPMGVYVVDSQFRLQQVNARALPAFAKVDARKGRDFAEVMHILWGQKVGDQLVAIFRHTLATGEPYVSPNFSEKRQDLGVEKSYEWETQRVTLPDGQHGVVCYFNDVTERDRAAEALRNSEALYRTIGESINYGVWVCDPDGRNTYASESFLQLVGLTQEQCSNLGWGEVLHPDDLKATIAAWQECVRTGASWDREHRFKGVDGQWHHLLARGLPVKDAAGKIVSWAGINLDISNLKRAEVSLLKAKSAAEAASRAKDDFLAALSHELRTPLNPALLIASESSGDPQLPAIVRQNFDIIRKSIELEARLIDDLLDLTRIISGKLPLEKKNMDVHAILRDALTIILSEQQTKQIHLTQKLDAAKFFVIGDAVRLQQVFWNVLKNAVKFTPPRRTHPCRNR